MEDQALKLRSYSAFVWGLWSTEKPEAQGGRLRFVEGERQLLLQRFAPKDREIAFAAATPGPGQNYHKHMVIVKTTEPETRFLHVFRVLGRTEKPPEERWVVTTSGRGPRWLELSRIAGDQRVTLDWGPWDEEPGFITVTSRDGTGVPARPLPSGILPHTPEGLKLLEQWDGAYRGGKRPGWDTGRPSSQLVRAVESGKIKPCRTLELGCGLGTNAIYLAGRKFDVSALDIAPSALAGAMERAKKTGVSVRWVLADVLAPPKIGPFDFIYDRGCYHGVRRGNAAGYVQTLRKLTRPGSLVLIEAGNANEARQYGPPRVKEEELRADFSPDFEFVELRESHFDTSDPNATGALSWFVLLRRKEKP